jgi:hypothetical protein
MTAMDARRLELYELLKPALTEEPARALVLALPDSPEELVTKSYLDARLDAFSTELRAEIAKGRGETASLGSTLREEIAGAQAATGTLGAELRAEIAGARAETVTLGREFRAEMAGARAETGTLGGELRAEMAELRADLVEQISRVGNQVAELDAKLTRRMVGILGAWTVAVASAFAWAAQLFG